MSEINLDVVKQFIEQNKDNEDVKAFINGFINSKTVESFLETDEGKKLIQPRIDRAVTKGIDTYKNNNLAKLIDEEIARRYPAETPEAKQLRELQKQLEEMKQASLREKIKAAALVEAGERGLPTTLASLVVCDTEEATRDALNTLEIEFKSALEKAISERLKGQTPATSTTSATDDGAMTKEKLIKMPYSQRVEFMNKNPELYKRLMGQ